MTAGRLQCLGGQQHLKVKYGAGYALELRCEQKDEARVGSTIPQLFPGAIFSSCHAGKFRFDLPFEIVSLATVFETMEVHKQSLGILDYSASQPTLESIFLAIAEKDINRTGGASPADEPAAQPAADAAAAASRSPVHRAMRSPRRHHDLQQA
uniref:ABCA1-4-like C-terminal R2 regulatory domain-containing protein n=1 Tax=Haptolina ericina TaxID=156174 RepID=A0A7S3BNQ7_9EUKA